MGEYKAALPLAEEAVAMARRILGPAHEETLTAVASLGAIHSSRGEYALARPLLEQALEAISTLTLTLTLTLTPTLTLTLTLTLTR